MKLGKYILGLALVALAFTSCDQENEGAIYDAPAMPNLSFTTASLYGETEGDELTIPVTITRTYSTEPYTTTVNMTTTNSKAKLRSNQVSFGAKETSATVYVDATNLDWGDECVCTLTLPDVDVQGANPFDSPIHQMTVTIKKPALVAAGTCTFIDYTWGDDDGNPVGAENVPIINVEGTNKYRIISPLYYCYKDMMPDPDMSYFQFNLQSDGSVTVDDGLNLDWWGYVGYYDATNYGGYCYVERDGNQYTVNELLLYGGSSLYTGGMFVFIWDKP